MLGYFDIALASIIYMSTLASYPGSWWAPTMEEPGHEANVHLIITIINFWPLKSQLLPMHTASERKLDKA